MPAAAGVIFLGDNVKLQSLDPQKMPAEAGQIFFLRGECKITSIRSPNDAGGSRRIFFGGGIM